MARTCSVYDTCARFTVPLAATLVVAGLLGCSDDDPAENPASGPSSGDFLALTYNVAGLPEGFTSSPNPLARMPLIGQLLNDYDLVLTQEDWETPVFERPEDNPFPGVRVYHEILVEHSNHPYRSISEPLPLGNDPAHWPATANRPAIAALLSDGLNRFSQLEFDPEKVERVSWADCFGDFMVGAADCMATKGFSVATHVLAPGVELDVYNLHGEAGGTEQDVPLLLHNFEQQLADFISDPARAGRAIILGGDTNLHTDRGPPGEAWRTFLTRTGLSDVCDTVDCGADADQIDKFAYRSSAALEIVPLTHEFESAKFSYEGGELSDHEPLSVHFSWKRR